MGGIAKGFIRASFTPVLVALCTFGQNTGTISTVAGTGVAGYSGDKQPAVNAKIDGVTAVASDGLGNFYLADCWNSVVRRIKTDGTIETVAGTGITGFSGDGGLATAATLSCPRGLAFDSFTGGLYISDAGNARVRKVSGNGIITTVAGNGTVGYSGDGGQAVSASLSQPRGLALDASHALYIADTWNFVIRKVDTLGVITTVAGSGGAGLWGDAAKATSAGMGLLQALAFDTFGNLYVSDASNQLIRKINSAGVISSLSVAGQLSYPRGIAADALGAVIVADQKSNRILLEGINATVTVVAGTGAAGFGGDGGPATQAKLSGPYGLALAPDGSIYTGDAGNYRVRKISTGPAVPILKIAKSHTGNFTQGQIGAIYAVVVSNDAAAAPTSGTVTVTETIPTGLSLVSMTGSGWACTGNVCTRNNTLAAGGAYPPITATVNVAPSAPAQVANQVSVSGGGTAGVATATDTTVIVPSGPVNLALGKPAAQSSALTGYGPAGASNAVDGNTDGSFFNHSVTHTNLDPYAWWQVDLGTSSELSSIVVWNRTDCCMERLNDYWVFVSDTPFLSTDTPDTLKLRAATWSNHQTTAPNPSTAIPAGVQGRYVRVQLAGTNYLSLAEVQVMSASVANPVLNISKTHSGNFKQGQPNAVYTVTVSNGASAAPSSGVVTVTETIPSGLAMVSMAGAGWTCSSVACIRSDSLAAGGSYPPITVTVNVAANASSPQVNTVGVSGGGSPAATATDPTIIDLLPAWTIAKTHSGNFTQGQLGAAYSVKISNTGAGPSAGTVTVTDTIPAGLSLVSMAGAGWTCAANVCTRSDTLTAGGAYPLITATVNVVSNAPPQVTNQVSVSGGGATGGATATDATVIVPSGPVNLALGKPAAQSSTLTGYGPTDASNAVDGNTDGSFFNHSVTHTNSDPNAWWQVDLGVSSALSSIVIWNRTDCCGDRLKDYWVFVSDAPFLSTETLDTLKNRAGTWNNHQTTAPTPSTTIPAAGVQGRYVRVQLTETNYLSLAEVQVMSGVAAPALNIAKTHSGNFKQGQTGAAYTVTVSNAAAASSTSGTVTVTETIPSGLTLVSMAGTGWACAANVCTRADALAAGTAYPPITVTVNVAANASSPQVNTVGVSGGGAVAATATDSTIIDKLPVWAIAKTHTGNFTLGQLGVTYTVTVTNTGAGPSNGTVTVTDTIPTGLSLVSMTGAGWACTGNVCTRGDVLAAGSPYPPLTVTANVASNAPSVVTNQVSVSGGGAAAAATATDPAIIGGLPVWKITKTHSGDFTQGQPGAIYTVTVSNAGTGPSAGTVTVTETVPSGLSLVSMTGTGWTCTGTACTRGDTLLAGASHPPITVTVNVASTAPAQLSNQVSVSGGGAVAAATATDSTAVGGVVNVAKGKPATQISTLTGYGPTGASNAVDGNTDGNFFNQSVSHTNSEPNAWWQVDLGISAPLSYIVIWNRTDCCSDRLNNYWIFVSDTPFLPTDTPDTLKNRAGTWSSYQTTAPNPSAAIPAAGATGRYVRVQLTGTNYLHMAEVQVMSGTATPASIVPYTGTPQSTNINTAFSSLAATVKNAAGDPVTGVTVTFTAPSSGPSGSFTGGGITATATTDSSGRAWAPTFTANSVTGSYTVTATVTGVATPANFALTNTSATPASIVTFTGTPQSTNINTAFSSLAATVKNAAGDTVTGVTVTFTAPSSGPSGTFTGAVNTATAKTDSSGRAYAPTFTANSLTGSYTVTATVTGVATPANFALTNTSATPASIVTFTGTPQSTNINTAFSSMAATVKNAAGDPVTGVTVTFTAPSSGPSGTFTAGTTTTNTTTAKTDSSGRAWAPTFTANSVTGSYTVTATVTGVATPANFALTNTSATPASIVTFTGTPQSTNINTAFSSMAATVKNAAGDPVTGVTVTFTAPSSGPSGTFTAGTTTTNTTTAKTDSSGRAWAPTFTANSVTGSYTVTATVTGVATPANFLLTNTSATPASIVTFTGTPQSTNINTAFSSMAATVKNAAGDTVTGVTVTFTAPSSGPSGTFTAGTTTTNTTTAKTDSSGRAWAPTFTANSVTGSYTVTATVTGVATPANFLLTNTSATPASIVTFTGTPQSTNINTAFSSLAATVKNAAGDPVTGATVTFTAPSSGPSGSFTGAVNTATAKTDSSGRAWAPTFTANSVTGSYTVTATVTGVATPANFLLTNTSATPASIVTFTGTPQSTNINTAFSSLAATVKNAAGDPVTGATVTFTAPPSGPSGTFTGAVNTATAKTDSSGRAWAPTFTANSVTGSYTVTATVTGVATPANFLLTNTSATPASIVPYTGTPQNTNINTAFSSLAATVKNAAGDTVTGVTVTFTAPSSGPSGSFTGGGITATATTDSSGRAWAPTFTANSVTGSYTVTATVTGVATPANFLLTNTSATPASIVPYTGTPQNTNINTAFSSLAATVKNAAGDPVTGVTVTFTVPSSGPSGSFTGAVNTATAKTDSSGRAWAPTFTANSVTGSYTVTATVTGVATPANFLLTNTSATPALTITKTHSGNFKQGQTGAIYTVTVSNGTFGQPNQWNRHRNRDTSIRVDAGVDVRFGVDLPGRCLHP